jgi:hypothetical protein
MISLRNGIFHSSAANMTLLLHSSTVYLYGFLKMSTGPHEGAFFHPKFVRDNRDACLAIRRGQFKGDRRRQSKAKEAKENTTAATTRASPKPKPTSTAPRVSSKPTTLINEEERKPLNNKAALTLFDRVFTLIDDDAVDDHPAHGQSSSSSRPSSLPLTTTTNVELLLRGPSEYHESADLVPEPTLAPVDGNEDWFHKILEANFSESSYHHHPLIPPGDFFDIAPRPIEEMLTFHPPRTIFLQNDRQQQEVFT